MNPTPSSATHPIDAGLQAIEQALASLSSALRERSPAAIEQQSQQLHAALQQAVADLNLAARRGEMTPALRERLVRTSHQIARQQEVLTRASVSLDRLLVGLRPAPAVATYGSSGGYSSRSVNAPYSAG